MAAIVNRIWEHIFHGLRALLLTENSDTMTLSSCLFASRNKKNEMIVAH